MAYSLYPFAKPSVSLFILMPGPGGLLMLSTDNLTQFSSRTQFICRFTKVCGAWPSWCFGTWNFDIHVRCDELKCI